MLASAPIAAGTYSIAARYAGDPNYNQKQSAAATIQINRQPASVTPDAKTKVYGSADPTLTGTLVGFVPSDGVTAAYSRTAGEDVASSPYTISAVLSPATVLGNYDITYHTALFTITKADPIVTATGNTCTYNGLPCAGSGSAVGVHGESLTPVTVAYSTLPAPGNLLTSAPSAAGTYSIAARYAGDANYNAKQSAASVIQINKQPASVTPDAKTKVYGSADPALTGTLLGFVPSDGVTATYARTAGETVGGSPYTISATLAPMGVLANYNITYNTAAFTITKADPIVTATGNTCTYSGSPCAGSGSAKGVNNEDLTPVTLAYAVVPGPGNLLTSAPTAAGTYSVAARYAGDPNYNAKQSAAALITINRQSASVTPDAKTKVYGAADPTLTGTLLGFVSTDGVSATYARTTGETVGGGPYTISATLAPLGVLANYDIVYNTAAFTITKADPVVTATGNTCTYNGSPCAGNGSAKGVNNEDLGAVTLAYSTSPAPGNLLTSAPTAAGTYSVAARFAGDSNYNQKQSGAATIQINRQAASVTPDAKTKVYGTADPTFTGTLSGFLAGDVVTATYGRTAGETVGGSPYTISATLAPAGVLSNYDIVYNTAQFTITKAEATVTATGNSCTYNGNPCAGSGSAKGVNNEDLGPVTLAYSTSPAPGNLLTSAPAAAGTYSVAARFAGDSNYNQKQSSSAAITIGKALASVTPAAATKMYGSADPALTGVLSGFLAGDNITAAYSRTAGEAVAGSPYTISAVLNQSVALANYTVTYNTAQFCITAKPASVTPAGASKVYGSPDPALTGSFNGFLPSDGVTATYSRTSGESVGGSPYTISATLSPLGVLSNYAVTYNTATFTITKKAASVTPDSKSKAFGAQDPVLTGTLGGFLASDGMTATYTRAPGESASGSPYTISATLAPAGVLANYAITYNTGQFTISPLTFNGFLSPLGGADASGGTPANPLRTIKLNSTLPVKFSLSSGSTPYLTGTHTIAVYQYTNAVFSSEPAEIVSTDAATDGDTFRLTDGQWHFNLNTKGLGTGTWKIEATLSDGTTHSAVIAIKK